MRVQTFRYPATLVGLLALWMVVCSGAIAAEHIEIPSEACRHYFMIPIYAGERSDPLMMLYDTGASTTIVDQAALNRVTGKKIRTGKKVRIRSAKVGPITFKKGLRAKVMKLDHLSDALGMSLDGILSYDVFGKDYLVSLDYPSRRFTLQAGRLPGANELEQQGRIEPLLKSRTGRPYVRVEIDNQPHPMLIDSGSGGGLAIHTDPPVNWSGPLAPLRASVRINRIELGEVGRLAADVKIGGKTLVTPTAEVTSGSSQLIGNKILRHFRVTFDWRQRKMAWFPVDDEPIQSKAIRGTGAIWRHRGDHLEVLRVLPDSPAERAGLKKGDKVVEVEGTPLDQMGCDGLSQSIKGDEAIFLLQGSSTPLVVGLTEFIP